MDGEREGEEKSWLSVRMNDVLLNLHLNCKGRSRIERWRKKLGVRGDCLVARWQFSGHITSWAKCHRQKGDSKVKQKLTRESTKREKLTNYTPQMWGILKGFQCVVLVFWMVSRVLLHGCFLTQVKIGHL